MAHATGTIGTTHYAVTIDASGHRLLADEPPSMGGANAGPAPFDLLLAALTACTSITLSMYADHKRWDLKSLTVGVNLAGDEKDRRIDRTLRLEGNLTEEQRSRLADVAERTPVTLTLKNGLPILTRLDPGP
jgi:putative redox protein